MSGIVTAIVEAAAAWQDPTFPDRVNAVRQTLALDNAFTREAVDEAIRLSMSRLTFEAIRDWIGAPGGGGNKRIAVLNAGNVPLVGLQDFLAVTLTGNRYFGVLSRRSPFLLPSFGETIAKRIREVTFRFVSLEEAISNADALIATGSTATTRLLSKRFADAGVAPSYHLLRGTRTGAAVLRGGESENELAALAKDVLLHEGRGCRNVSTILAPARESPLRFVSAGDRLRERFPSHPTTSESVKRVCRFLGAVGEPAHVGNGFVILENEVQIPEPSLVRWIAYRDLGEVEQWLGRNHLQLQVVVTNVESLSSIPDGVEMAALGEAQDPPLNWQPDGIDTLSFLRRNLVSGI